MKMKIMNKKLMSLAMMAGLMGMGLSMPSCPGQQAMQQQIDQLTASNADMTKKLQVQDNKIKGLESDMGQVKQLLAQATNVIKAQDDGLRKLEGAVTDMSAKLAAATAPKPAPAPKGKAAAKAKKRR